MMKTVHFILQGKGGVGKSLISSFLCQYLSIDGNVYGIDTDPVNRTLFGYKDLNVKHAVIRDDEYVDNIDSRKFDGVIEDILNQEDDCHIIVDNGSSVFLPICSYIKENAIFELLADSGCKVYLHTLITGGQAMGDTADGIELLAKSFPETPIVVWLNSFFGAITAKGKSFEEFEIYKKYKDIFHCLIHIPLKNPQTYGKDLQELFQRKETFENAINDTSISLLVRQRLKIYWREVCGEIEQANLINVSDV